MVVVPKTAAPLLFPPAARGEAGGPPFHLPGEGQRGPAYLGERPVPLDAAEDVEAARAGGLRPAGEPDVVEDLLDHHRDLPYLRPRHARDRAEVAAQPVRTPEIVGTARPAMARISLRAVMGARYSPFQVTLRPSSRHVWQICDRDSSLSATDRVRLVTESKQARRWEACAMTDEDRITGRTSNVRQLFTGRRYTIDTYQREYSWETKHVEDLVTDLGQRFLGEWSPLHERREVQHYQSYFLGPIITTADERINLIDGQQRLTTLTLLLIFLRRLQEGRDDAVTDIGPLIYSQLYGEESFTLDIADRRRGMNAVLRNEELDPKKASPSERTLIARYHDIEDAFPEALRGEALPFFIDWLLGRVVVAEIITHHAAIGQEIFETMNDRGQRLTSLDMLKSYLVGRARRYGGDVHDAWRGTPGPLAAPDPAAPTRPIEDWHRARYDQ